jgi:lysophospholipase L1-like esterase
MQFPKLAGRSRVLTICLALWPCGVSLLRADEDAFAKWEPAIAAFELQDRATPPTDGGIVFVGSSSIRLWDVKQSFPDLPVINRGFGGSEIADSAHFAERIVVPCRPRIVVLYAGDNDLSRDKSPCRVHDDFQAFAARVHAALPETRIVFISVKPSEKRWPLIHRMRALNALVRAACAEDARLTFVDVEPAMLGADGRPRPELFREDQLHLNEAGYRLWTELLQPHLSLD